MSIQLRSNVVLIKVSNTMHVCNTIKEISKLIDKSVVQLSRYKRDTLVYDAPKYTIWFDCEVHKSQHKGQDISILGVKKLSKVLSIKPENISNKLSIKENKINNNITELNTEMIVIKPELNTDMIINNSDVDSKSKWEEAVRINNEKLRLKKESQVQVVLSSKQLPPDEEF